MAGFRACICGMRSLPKDTQIVDIFECPAQVDPEPVFDRGTPQKFSDLYGKSKSLEAVT